MKTREDETVGLRMTRLKTSATAGWCVAVIAMGLVLSSCDSGDAAASAQDDLDAPGDGSMVESESSGGAVDGSDEPGNPAIAWPGSTPPADEPPSPGDETDDPRETQAPTEPAQPDSGTRPKPPNDTNPAEPSEPSEPGEWREDDPLWQCENGTPVSTIVEFVIPGRGAGCGWNEGDQLPPTQGAFAGYQRDVSVVELPGNAAAICGVNLDFASYLDTYAQPFLYDDHFILTFADIVLLSSYADIVESLEEVESGMKVYDWTPIAGSSMSFNNGYAYCLGYGETDTVDCQIPGSESNGAMAFSIGGPIADVLSARAVASQNASFSIVTFGDNDSDTDCRHSEVRFQALVDYVLRP